MPQIYLRICLLWTCLATTLVPIHADPTGSLPPSVLSNPSGCNLALPIKDFSCDASHFYQIQVTNAPGNSLGIDVYLKEVRLIIAHEWDADLDITLISPNDVAINLSSDNGSGQDNYGNPFDCNEYTSFISTNTTEACNTLSITDGIVPFIGEHLSEQAFTPLNDGTNPNDIWVLQICDDGKEHDGTLEFVELVFEATTCLNPTGVEIISVDSTTAFVDWTPGFVCDSSILEFGPIGFDPGSSQIAGSASSVVVLDSCPPVLLTGLNPSTAYELYVRTKCANSFSINSCSVTFSTTCSPPVVTVKEDFNQQQNCMAICGVPCPISGVWQNSLIDDFDWIVNDNSNITNFGTGPDDDNPGGGKYIYIESSGSSCRNGKEGVLISNCMQVNASADSCDMSFDYLMFGSNVNSLRLEYKETDSTNWKLIDLLAGNSGDKWITRFLDLDHLDGQTVQFRFVAVGGNGIRADIALDNIIFYGSVDLGPPLFTYYQDADMDGYGGQDVYFSTCSFQSFTPGFVPNNQDCDDTQFFINPGATEYPCDGIDLNCNGNVDEFQFAAPMTFDTTICSGLEVPFTAQPSFNGNIIWSSDSLASDTVHIGEEFWLTNFPDNFTDTPLTITYYARESINPSCFSTSLSAANITILPQADINTTDNPTICEGDFFDLSTVDVIDNNGANGVITYHDSGLINQSSEISPIISPISGQTYYIASTPNGGCTDIASVNFNILPSPVAEIIGEESVCKNTQQTLMAVDNNQGLGQVTYEWNTGDSSQIINISSHPAVDSTNTFILRVGAENGCTALDTLNVTTINNISQVLRVVEDVTTCGGSDGTIKLVPLDGTPPYTFRWGNNMTHIGDSLFLENLSQGAQSFTITDSSPEQCEFIIPFMTVNGPGAVVASSQITNVSCNGAADGVISLNVNGTNPVIAWSNGASTEMVTGLAAGSHSVTITDGICENIIDFEISQPDKLTINPTITSPSCNGSSDGGILLNVFGGSPPYQYQWENGFQTREIKNLPAGTYSVTVADSKGCIQEIPALEINQPAAISFDTTGLFQPSCFGFNDGRISIKPSGGTSPFDVDWDNDAMGTTINNLSSGNYVMTIEDANGCTFNDTLFLGQPSPIFIAVDEKINPACKGQSNGSINISVNGGTMDYNYSWNNGPNSEDISGLPEGSYVVSIIDANGCGYNSDPIILTGPELITLEAELSHPPCAGRNDGTIMVSANGTGSYSYEWDIDESGPVISDQAPGCYTVTVTDTETNCKIDTTFCLTTSQELSLNVDFNPPSCFAQPTGEIFLIASGGTQPYTYSWADSNDTTDHRFALPAGNYPASVTDAEGCIISTNDILLEYPEQIQVELVNFDAPICYGDSTGIIEVSANGGTGSLLYIWSTGDTISALNHLGEGIYSVSIADENNCLVDAEYTIEWPDQLEVQQNQFIPDCTSLDSVCIEVSGGEGPYIYEWNNGDSMSCLNDVPVGDYIVTITDNLGCTTELMSVKVPEDVSPIYIQQLPSKDSLCFGDNNGTLCLLLEGGNPPYQYLWDNGLQGSSMNPNLKINNLSTGQYRVTITDEDGCTSSSSFLEIIQAPELAGALQQIDSVSCKNGEDGAISVVVSGGYAPYEFLWTNSAGDTIGMTAAIDSLSAGSYFGQITDDQNCTDEIVGLVEEPLNELQLDSFQISDITCFGDEDAEIEIFPAGGTLPYLFDWSNGDSVQHISDIGIGTYNLIISDKNSCRFTKEFTVEGPDIPITLSFYNIETPPCFGETGGSIDVDFTGGTPPYYYDWGNSNNEDLLNITAGEYFLTVIDSTTFCSFDTVFVVDQPSQISVDTSSTPEILGNMDGTASITVMGGTPPYQYYWDTGDTTSTITDLAAGWYDFTVTDSLGCDQEGTVQVTVIISVFDKERILDYQLYPNPASNFVQLQIQLTEFQNMELQLLNALGEIVFNSEERGRNIHWDINMSEFPSGMYYISLKNESGLVLSDRLIKL
ncbi:MAG: T9SS type A sorting domain-containing protein [Bacteroidota bacterium]